MRTPIAVFLAATALSLPAAFSAQVIPPDAPAVPEAADAPAALPFIGAWTLNHDLSSKPPERGERAQGERPQGGGRGRGGFGGGFGGGRGGGGFGGRGGGTGQMSDGDRQKLVAAMRRMREAPERLTITFDGKVVAFADGDGRTWKTTTDGRKQTLLTGDGEIEVKAHLDGHELVVEETVSGRARLTYTYTPVEDAGTRRLSVQVTMDGGGSARAVPELTRVYDAIAP